MKKNTSWKFTDELSISGSGEFGLREIQLLPPLSFVPLNGYWLFSAKPTLFIVFVSSLILYTTHWTEIVAVSFLLEKLEIDLLPEACQVFGLQPFSGLFFIKKAAGTRQSFKKKYQQNIPSVQNRRWGKSVNPGQQNSTKL